jgi:hypothetical protein
MKLVGTEIIAEWLTVEDRSKEQSGGSTCLVDCEKPEMWRADDFQVSDLREMGEDRVEWV